MDFKTVQEFFKSWGLYPSEESTDSLREEVVNQGINRRCYGKLQVDAEDTHGASFTVFCAHVIDATDEAFYVAVDTWAELEEAWNAFQKGQGPN